MKIHSAYVALAALFAFCAAGCSKVDSGQKAPQDDKTAFIKESIPQKHVDQVSSRFAGSKYLNNYTPADFTAGVSLVKENPLEKAFAYSFNRRYETCAYASTLPENATPLRISASGVDLSASRVPTRSGGSDLAGLFGRKTTFRITSTAPTRSGNGGGASAEVSLYIPKPIEIAFPRVTSDEDFYPFCYSKDFVLRWNADPDNKNGVILVAQWNGVTVAQGDYDAFVRRIELLDDTGEAHLDPALFDGLPNTALLTLTLLRGDVENIDIDNCTYKVSGETHAYINPVLVTKIKSKSTL